MFSNLLGVGLEGIFADSREIPQFRHGVLETYQRPIRYLSLLCLPYSVSICRLINF